MKNLTRRGFVGLGASAAAAALFAGCSPSGGPSTSGVSAPSSSSSSANSSSAAATGGSELRFATGGQSGTYYSFGRQLAQHASSHAGVDVAALVSDGARANVEALEEGSVDLAFCQSDVMASAFKGTGPFEGEPRRSFSAVALLYDEQVQVITRDPAVKTVADLAGKRVSIGAPGSGASLNAIDVLGAYDVAEQDFTPTYQSIGDSAESLGNGQIDAAIIVTDAPSEPFASLIASKSAYLVGLDDEHVDALVRESPHYARATVAAGTYSGQERGAATVSVGAVILAADTVAEDDVHAFVKDVFDGAADEATASAHRGYGKLSAERGASIASVPYHPGAARFFGEAGFPVEAKRTDAYDGE